MSNLQKSLEALKLALKTEEEGYRLYRTGAEQSKNELVKSIFLQLFKDELMHIDLIKRFYAHLNDSESWASMTNDERNYKGLKGEFRTIYSTYLEKIGEGKESFSENDLEVYQKAIEFEKNGVVMYSRLFDESSDDNAKKFYSFLRDMEQEHADVLDNTYQYLKNPDSWYLNQEGWTMDY